MNENLFFEQPGLTYEMLLRNLESLPSELSHETQDTAQLNPVERLHSIHNVWQASQPYLGNVTTALDVGSGFGYGVAYLNLQGIQVVGIENVATKVTQGQELFKAAGLEIKTTTTLTPQVDPTIVTGNLEDISGDQLVDLITMFYLSGELVMKPGTFELCKKLLTPGGKILLSTEAEHQAVEEMVHQLSVPFTVQIVDVPDNFEKTSIVLSS